MSSATMRRGRDERTGADARLDGDNQYVAFMPGEQTADSGQVGQPDTVDEHGRSLEALEADEARESSFDYTEGAAVSDEADYDADLHNESGETSADAVEGYEVSDNPDPAAADVHESAIRANPEPDTPAWVYGGPAYNPEYVNTEGTSSADDVDTEGDEADAGADDE